MRSNPTIAPSRGFVRTGDQLFVTIDRGTNVRNHEGTLGHLTRDRWQSFKDDTTNWISSLISPSATFGPFEGDGTWIDDATGEEVDETSAVLGFTVGYTARVEDVESVLAGLAHLYDQDAIAWTSGPGNLVRQR
mgnify:CR=1 FL=1